MINVFLSLPLFKFSLTIPSLYLPGGPGDIQIVSDQNAVCRYIGPHRWRAQELQTSLNNASCVYVQARRNG